MADIAKAFGAPARNHTFTSAAESYVANGGEARYLPPIIEWMANRPLTEIAPFDIRQMAEQLLPECKNSTRNRQVITPARAVLSHAYDRGWGPLMRIRNLKTEPPAKKPIASAVWMFAFLKQCGHDHLDHLGAIVLFMHQTGARVSEACRVQWADLDLPGRKVVLTRTKTGRFEQRHLTDELVARIGALPRLAGKPVFQYKARWSVNGAVRRVCERAGIPYKSSHTLGRHSFANNAMDAGFPMPIAMQAGGWKSAKVFAETYVHSKTAGRDVSDQFSKMRYDAAL